jgi:exodeoxyribonuclease VII small subunit
MTEKTFRKAFGVLQQHAETLRDQAEPNIDDLLTIVQESVEAYGVCKERIDAVETALKAALDGAGVGASATVPQPAIERESARAAGQPSKPAAPTSFDDMDDDIPF